MLGQNARGHELSRFILNPCELKPHINRILPLRIKTRVSPNMVLVRWPCLCSWTMGRCCVFAYREAAMWRPTGLEEGGLTCYRCYSGPRVAKRRQKAGLSIIESCRLHKPPNSIQPSGKKEAFKNVQAFSMNAVSFDEAERVLLVLCKTLYEQPRSRSSWGSIKLSRVINYTESRCNLTKCALNRPNCRSGLLNRG